MPVDDRSELLENCKELEQVHEQAATEGQTEVKRKKKVRLLIRVTDKSLFVIIKAPCEQEDVDLHFICFIEVDQHLYELDGRKLFPINHGKCTNLVEVCLSFSF